MSDEVKATGSQSPGIEGIDFNKLKTIFKGHWIWVLLIFGAVNFATYLFLRYSKDVYESTSVLKLDIQPDENQFQLHPVVEDQNLNIISGQIELIQSRLFLRRILDSLGLDVKYISRGEVLDFELYGNSPFSVTYNATTNQYFGVPFQFSVDGINQFTLQSGGEHGTRIQGAFGQPVHLPGLDLLIRKTSSPFTEGINYVFIINSNDVILNYLQSNLTVEPLDLNANTIRVAFKDNNPFKARDLVNRIDSMYLQYSNEQKSLANKQKIDWLTDELTQIEKKMEGYEEYFEQFTLQNKSNDLGDDLKGIVDAINRIDSERVNLSHRVSVIAAIQDKLTQQNYKLGLLPRTQLPDYLNKKFETLDQVYSDYQRLKLSYGESTYAVQSKSLELARLQDELAGELQNVKTDYDRRLDQLREQRIKLENEFSNIPDRSTQFNKNQRYYKLYEELYLSLMQSKAGFEITQAGTTPDFKILSPASMAQQPLSPQRSMITGIGLVGSITLNILFIGLLYLMNNKITSINELEKGLSLPVLGIVPASRKSTFGTFQVIDSPRSMISESFRTLRTNLDFFNPSAKSKVLAVSSTVSGEGKSFVAQNLGAVMALSQKRTILLDVDMRKNPTLGSFDNSRGMSTILIQKNNWKDCVQSSGVELLNFIPSGPIPPNPSELLLNGRFVEMLEEMKQEYDCIILDTPPVGVVTDGIMAMRQADLTIYIFRANYSKRDFLQSLKRLISINKFNNIALLLNALPPSSEKRYGYGYYQAEKKPGFIKSLFARS